MSLAAALRAALVAGGDPATAAAQAAYLKGKLQHHGWKGPAVEALFKAQLPALQALPPAAQVDLGHTLLDSPWAEEQMLGLLLLKRARRALPAETVAWIEPLFDRQVNNWATCDGICGRLLRGRLPHPAERARLATWSASPNPWRRRAACVAYVNEARKGLYADEIRAAVPAALALDDRFAQLGAGWLLRERSLAAQDEVVAFLQERRGTLRREALRYAIEKMPPALQAHLLQP